MSIDKDIVLDFVNESKTLIEPLTELLELAEEDITHAEQLADYGNKVDRVMGGAKSLGLMVPPEHIIHRIGDYSALCKAVAYKASQSTESKNLYTVSVAFLIDATEILLQIICDLEKDPENLQFRFSETFLERLRWISNQYSSSVSATVRLNKTSKDAKMGQEEINALLEKLGVL